MHLDKTMREICPMVQCTGCSACYNACRHQAINMTENELGHVYPQIDEDKCVLDVICAKCLVLS